MASGRALEHLFEADPGAYAVTLFNAEPRGNYNRIMLSPVLSGEKSYDEIVTHDADWYAAHGVTTRFGEAIAGIDRDRKVVVSASGDWADWVPQGHVGVVARRVARVDALGHAHYEGDSIHGLVDKDAYDSSRIVNGFDEIGAMRIAASAPATARHCR